MMSYETANSLPVVLAINAAFWLSVVAIGYCLLKLKDNGWRFSISMALAITTCVAILCVFVKLSLITK